jgi:hypothetical protein
VRVYINISNTNFIEPLTSLVQKLQQLIFPSITFASLYLFVIIILAFREVDPTEKYKLNLYALSFSIYLLAALVCNQLKNGNALIVVIQFSIISLFSILICYFHWPYEVEKDLIYEEQKHPDVRGH